MRKILTCVLVAMFVLVGGPRAWADRTFVDPYEAKSTTGEWVLHVEPSTPRGDGPAMYRMTRDGKAAWEAKIDHTLRECVVGSNGVVVGYAYYGSDLIVMALDADGKVLRSDPHTRSQEGYAMNPPPPPEPRCHGVLLDDAGQRAILRVSTSISSDGQTFWRYSLTDGHALETLETTFSTSDAGFGCQIDAQVVPGTSLIGVQWYEYGRGPRARDGDAVFHLLDESGARVWERRIESEYASQPEHWSCWDLVEDNVRQLEMSPSAFAIVSYSQKLRTSYTVAKDEAGTWQVTEKGTQAGEPKAQGDVGEGAMPLETAPGTLVPVKTVAFATIAAERVFDDIMGFSIDGEGRMGWIGWVDDPEPGLRFTLVDAQGGVVVNREVDLPEFVQYLPMLTWLEGDKWLIAGRSFAERTATSHACFYDASTGAVTRLDQFESGDLDRVCRFPMEGGVGFVVFAGFPGYYIAAYDHEGKRAKLPWIRARNPSIQVHDIAVLSDGTLAMLGDDVTDPMVFLYRPGQVDPEVVDVGDIIAKAAGADQNYITTIRADKDGGFMVYDSANENLLHRIDASMKNWASFHVSGPRGEKFRLYDYFAVAPDGRVWSSDHNHLYRAGNDGRAEVALGEIKPGTMGTPCAITMDERGWMYVVEEETASVHVFDGEGKAVKVMKPNPTDARTQDELSWVRVLPNGHVKMCMGHEAPVVTFDAEGVQIIAEIKDRWAWTEGKQWRPVQGGGWETNGSSVRRIKPDGAFTEVAYRPDGGWLVDVEHAAAASDGSLVLICGRRDYSSMFGLFGERTAWLCAYGPDGEPRGTLRFTIPLLFDRLSYDGTRAYLSDRGGVTVVPVPLTGQGTRFDYGDEDEVWDTMLCPDGTLASWRHEAHEVQYWKLAE